jgi:hypothetical protein
MSNKYVPDQDAFRFYEDGTESGSTQIAAENTNVTDRDLDAGDSQIHLRLRIQEVGGGSIPGETTDDYLLTYRLNGGGGYSAVTTSSTQVQIDTASTLTNDDPTTDRAVDGISDGTGSFFAGIQEAGDGEITDFQHEADNFTEHVFALLLISADLVNTDFIDFRLALNGGNPGMDTSILPQVSIFKTVAGDFPYHSVNEQRRAMKSILRR